jgi:hypothetical protein
MDLEIGSQSEWNGGMLTNMRIHYIREELKVCAMNKDLNTWLMLLVKMNHELYGFQTPQEKKNIRAELNQLAQEINAYQRIQRSIKYKKLEIKPEIIDKLNDMEYTLDEIFHKSGLQTALREDAGDSF